jgi:hypothetical protein
MKTKKRKRQKLAEGFIWFGDHRPGGYISVSLCTGANGLLPKVAMKVGKLGGWQKVKLYAEWIPTSRAR